MKTASFFILMTTILSACISPQVTVTLEVTATSTPIPTKTLTPSPTPTPHPQFVILQKQIAKSDRFILNSDGTIQDGEQIISDLRVLPEGIIVLIIDSEEIIVDTTEVNFGKNGLSIKNYQLDQNGKWIEITPMDILLADLEKWELSIDNYSIEYDPDNNIELRDKSGKLIYWNGRWAGDIIIDMVKSTNDCHATDFPLIAGNLTIDEKKEEYEKYRDELSREFMESDAFEGNSQNSPLKTFRFMMVYLGKYSGYCWGMDTDTVFNDGKILGNFLWRNASGELQFLRSFNTKEHK